jgi:branched-chain amino acid aminotransferase
LAEDVHTADEAFVTGTFAGVIPVIEVDGHEMSGGKRGEMTERLQKLYIDLIKRECGSD